jgi:anaerobic magnesium-protoporphyrin IX monomethyl ester cyclase
MRVLLINPPYITPTSNLGVGHQIPLGLLMVGGPLIDAGHEVKLLDAECRHISDHAIVREVRRFGPDVVMTGHSGSTPAHPVCVSMLSAIKAACPDVVTVYGGVYPTFHAREIIAETAAVDFIVRSEGEATAVGLLSALDDPSRHPIRSVAGIAFQEGGRVVLTPAREPSTELDHWRTGWELITDWDRYQVFGLGRSAIIQFSRGCVHSCAYCGQREFWRKWRHRDPVKVVDEIEGLHREHDIRFFPIADENAASDRQAWQRFLEELAARDLPVYLNVSVRSTDIVRDSDLLALYRKAGILYVGLGAESIRDEVLRRVRRTTPANDGRRACELLREHGIFTIMFYVIDLDGQLTWKELRHALRELSSHGPDWMNVMYLTPHSWTPFAQDLGNRRIIEPDLGRWDYRHPVLAQQHLKPWQLFLAAKWLELSFHLRPAKLWGMLREPGWFRKRQMLWCLTRTSKVWAWELLAYLAGRRSSKTGRTRTQTEHQLTPDARADDVSSS